MMKQRLNLLVTFLGPLFLFGFIALIPSAFCAGYPDRPIQLICSNVPGATGDISARMLAEELGPILGQKVIVNNKPGAGTVLGAETVLRSKKDGYTLLYSGNSAFVYAPNINPEAVHYDPVKDVDAWESILSCRRWSVSGRTHPGKPFRSWWITQKRIPENFASAPSGSAPNPISG